MFHHFLQWQMIATTAVLDFLIIPTSFEKLIAFLSVTKKERQHLVNKQSCLCNIQNVCSCHFFQMFWVWNHLIVPGWSFLSQIGGWGRGGVNEIEWPNNNEVISSLLFSFFSLTSLFINSCVIFYLLLKTSWLWCRCMFVHFIFKTCTFVL